MTNSQEGKQNKANSNNNRCQNQDDPDVEIIRQRLKAALKLCSMGYINILEINENIGILIREIKTIKRNQVEI